MLCELWLAPPASQDAALRAGSAGKVRRLSLEGNLKGKPESVFLGRGIVRGRKHGDKSYERDQPGISNEDAENGYETLVDTSRKGFLPVPNPALWGELPAKFRP
jgi:hypothetical protein